RAPRGYPGFSERPFAGPSRCPDGERGATCANRRLLVSHSGSTTNLGPFAFILKEGDARAQLTAAGISSAPDLSIKKSRSQTRGQTDPSGRPSSDQPAS